MYAAAVLGMNYGDEGKGHITNFLCDDKTLNIRFNGGAQAAHSVFLADGRSHVFHTFGSGTLKGARTLLSSHFLVNPLYFLKELDQLHSMKIPLRETFVDPSCRLTTPFDMLINDFSAKYRKANDTCGAGINETVERSMYRQLIITARDIVDKSDDQLVKILGRIENEWIPFRLDQLKLPQDAFKKFVVDHNVAVTGFASAFVKTARWMMEHSVVWEEGSLIDRFLAKAPGRKLVFEGAQGLILDQYRRKYMPYLTRSSTGLRNVLDNLKNVKTELELDVYLVTRAYLTRHGDGPIWNPSDPAPYKNIDNLTNQDNQYQGALRYGWLNQEWYQEALHETKTMAATSKKVYSVNVAMTCIDHLDGGFKPNSIMDSELGYTVQPGKELKWTRIGNLPSIQITSVGPKESDIRFVDESVNAHAM